MDTTIVIAIFVMSILTGTVLGSLLYHLFLEDTVKTLNSRKKKKALSVKARPHTIKNIRKEE